MQILKFSMKVSETSSIEDSVCWGFWSFVALLFDLEETFKYSNYSESLKKVSSQLQYCCQRYSTSKFYQVSTFRMLADENCLSDKVSVHFLGVQAQYLNYQPIDS